MIRLKKNYAKQSTVYLERKAAKICALSSNNLDKYEYLTGEDLDLKPSNVEQARFEYFPLGKVFKFSNITAEKALNLFGECAVKCEHCHLKKKSASLLPEGTGTQCTHLTP